MNPNAVKAHKIIVMGGGNYNNITIILARGSSCQGHSGTVSSFLTSVLSCAALWWHTFISFVSLSLSQPHTHCLVGLGPQSEHSKRSCFCSQTALGHDVHPLIAKLLRAWALCHGAAVGRHHLTLIGALARHWAGSGIAQARGHALVICVGWGAFAALAALILSSYRSLS